MRHRDALLGLAALAAVLPAAGCGASDDAAPTATTRVAMAKSYRFEPRAITVPVGATVTWTTAAAAVLAGLLVSYGLAVTTGVAVLHPEREAVEALALVTKAIGLAAAVSLLRRPRAEAAAPRSLPLAVAAIVAVFSAFVALELSAGHGHHEYGHAHGAAAHPERAP